MDSMRILATLVVASVLVFAAGCSTKTEQLTSGSGDNKPGAGTSSSGLIGHYKGKIVPAGAKDDPAAKLAEGLAGLFSPELEIQEGNKFVLTMMGMPISGSYGQSGENITLTPEKFMNMTPEELKKANEANKGGMQQEPDMTPMKGTVKDGKISIKDEKQGGTIDFVKEAPKKIGPSSVSADEAKFVGEYAAKLDPSKLKPEEKMMAGMAEMFSMRLEQDNTFMMRAGMTVEGKWSLADGKITLKADKAAGFTGPNGKDPQFKVLPDNTLEPIDSKGEAPFVMVKK